MQNETKNKKVELFFLALAPTGEGISGSDRIFIELAREWSKSFPVTIYTTQEGVEMMKRQHLSGKYLSIEKVEKSKLPGSFLLKYIYKIVIGIKLGFTFSFKTYYSQPATILYSSSDFWMDVLPSAIMKLRFNQLKWIATWFQTAPNPFLGFKEGKRDKSYNFSALLYKLSQFPIKPIVNRLADFVIVNNEVERKQYQKMNKDKKVLVLLGAVRLGEIEKWKSEHRLPTSYYRFDAVFQGRFHPQKGVVELINIWKKVVDRMPDAKLAMIGDGPLMNEVKLQIIKNKLHDNVKLFGYVFDGPEKYKIFSQSKLVVHPAFYDSGGMASAEAMAFGLPAIGFNLKAYESYYPKGMLKVDIGNKEKFAADILELIKDSGKRKRLGKEAVTMIEANWSWKKRAKQLLENLKLK